MAKVELKISNSSVPEATAIGPSDFVVFNGLIAVLDSDNHAISFFKKNGDFVKRIELPQGYYQRLIRDRNGALFAFSNNELTTLIVKISNKELEQKEININLDHLIAHALIDDFGLFFEASVLFNFSDLNKNQQCSSCILKEAKSRALKLKKQRIDRACFSCDPQEFNGPIINDALYQITYQSTKGEKPSLVIGDKEIKLNHQDKNAGTHIEQVDGDGTAWINESVFLDQYTVVTYILKIAPSGELQAIFRLPKIPVNDYVAHSIAISDQGEVWVMSGQSKGLSFDIIEALTEEQQLKFLESHQSSSLKMPNSTFTQQPKTLTPSLSNEPCQSRTDMFIRALHYIYHYQCLLGDAINNDSSCPGRAIPTYLIGNESKCLFSVSYSWGGFDSVESFRKKVELMKAGNVNTASSPLPTCTTGVDCSGFVSNLWGLKIKWSTGQIFEKTEPVFIDWMKTGDVFVKPNNHVLFYGSRINDELSTFESTVRPGKVIISQHEIAWFVQHGYMPRIAFNACEE